MWHWAVTSVRTRVLCVHRIWQRKFRGIFGSAGRENPIKRMGTVQRWTGCQRYVFSIGNQFQAIFFYALSARPDGLAPQKLHHSLSSLNFHIVHLNHTHFFILCTNSVGLVVSFYL